MDVIRDLQKRYCTRAMFIAIVLALLFILLGHKAPARGLILGTLFSILNFILMGQGLLARLGKSSVRTFAAAMTSVLFRYALLSVPLIVALLYEPYHIVTAVAGLFMVQAMILLEGLANMLRKGSSATGFGN